MDDINRHDPTADNDPLVGIQEHTDSPREAETAPPSQVTLERAPLMPPRRSRLIAGLLGVFLGGLGLHRFYLGYRKVGVVILAVTLAPVLIVLIVGAMSDGATTAAGSAVTAAGVATPGLVWGLIEGLAIFAGILRRDATGHALA